MNAKEIEKYLRSCRNSKNIEGMARFGIRPKTEVLGIPIPKVRKLAKEIGKNHKLAKDLWDLDIHEARILASIIAEKEKLTEKEMGKWVKGFDSWDIVDQTCMNLFSRIEIKIIKKKIIEYAKADREFEKRVSFALMAAIAVHRKGLKDEFFLKFFPLIKRASVDERNFVRKAVNWALRQIGKRNKSLNAKAIKLAKEIEKIDSKSARWIAKDAIRELTSSKIKYKLK